jgi:hypothetical protein
MTEFFVNISVDSGFGAAIVLGFEVVGCDLASGVSDQAAD